MALLDKKTNRYSKGDDTVDKTLIEGICTRPEGVPCLLEFNPEMDCGDCGFYDDHTRLREGREHVRNTDDAAAGRGDGEEAEL